MTNGIWPSRALAAIACVWSFGCSRPVAPKVHKPTEVALPSPMSTVTGVASKPEPTRGGCPEVGLDPAIASRRRLVMPTTAHRFLHGGPVSSLAVSTDGRWLITADATETLRVFDRKTGCLRQLRGMRTESVPSRVVALNGKGQVLAAIAGHDVALARLPDLSEITPHVAHSGRHYMFTPDEKTLVLSNLSDIFQLPAPLVTGWKTAQYFKRPPTPPGHGRPEVMGFSWLNGESTPGQLVSLDNDCKVRSYFADRSIAVSVQAHRLTNIQGACAAVDRWGNRIVSVGREPRLAITDLAGGKSVPLIADGSADAIAVHPTQDLALIGDSFGVALVNLASGDVLTDVKRSTRRTRSPVAWEPSGERALYADGHRVRTVALKGDSLMPAAITSDGAAAGFRHVSWSDDGKELFGNTGKYALSFDAKTGALHGGVETGMGGRAVEVAGAIQGMYSSVMLNDRHWFAPSDAVRLDSESHRWVASINYREKLAAKGRPPPDWPAYVRADCLAGAQATLLIVDGQKGTLWRAGKQSRTYKLPESAEHCAASHDGRQFVVATKTALLRVGPGAEVTEILRLQERPTAIAVGEAVAIVAYHLNLFGGKVKHTLEAVDLATGRRRWVARLAGEVRSFAWSPDGKSLAVAGDDMRIHVLNGADL